LSSGCRDARTASRAPQAQRSMARGQPRPLRLGLRL
jgi:hypothetical protein